jgi:hypothetical protein
MKRILSLFLALAVSATLVLVATTSKASDKAVHDRGVCSDATLTGSYAAKGTGFLPLGSDVKDREVPIAAVGVDIFDGAGSVSTGYTLAVGGVSTPGLTGTGTYTVNPDCTGSMSFTTGDAAGITSNLVIISNGTEFFEIFTSPASTVTGDAKKQ